MNSNLESQMNAEMAAEYETYGRFMLDPFLKNVLCLAREEKERVTRDLITTSGTDIMETIQMILVRQIKIQALEELINGDLWRRSLDHAQSCIRRRYADLEHDGHMAALADQALAGSGGGLGGERDSVASPFRALAP